MSKSKSRKLIEKQIKKGKNDPRLQRNTWGNVKPILKVKENKRRNDVYDYDRAYNIV